jgi:phosphoglycerol transferase MdoB-like AlkP superfamily enzyme
MKKRKEKYFAYISISVLSHDDFNTCAYLDRPTNELMSKLFEGDLMDDTMIFFFSDHGIRIGDIRLTHSGGIEARLPFMFIHLPKNSLNEFRDNLTINENRLITHFDIHSTFEHILNGK